MAEAMSYDRAQFREVVRHPLAHAVVLGQYRLGEHAGVVALRRLPLELFAERVLPGFEERHAARARRKAEALAPYVARALERMPPLDERRDVPPVESYPVLMQRLGVDMQQLMEAQGRSLAHSLDEWKRTRVAGGG